MNKTHTSPLVVTHLAPTRYSATKLEDYLRKLIKHRALMINHRKYMDSNRNSATLKAITTVSKTLDFMQDKSIQSMINVYHLLRDEIRTLNYSEHSTFQHRRQEIENILAYASTHHNCQ